MGARIFLAGAPNPVLSRCSLPDQKGWVLLALAAAARGRSPSRYLSAINAHPMLFSSRRLAARARHQAPTTWASPSERSREAGSLRLQGGATRTTSASSEWSRPRGGRNRGGVYETRPATSPRRSGLERARGVLAQVHSARRASPSRGNSDGTCMRHDHASDGRVCSGLAKKVLSTYPVVRRPVRADRDDRADLWNCRLENNYMSRMMMMSRSVLVSHPARHRGRRPRSTHLGVGHRATRAAASLGVTHL